MRNITLILFVFISIGSFGQTEKVYHTETCEVKGAVTQTLNLDISALSAFEHHNLDSLPITNHRGELKNTLRNIEGVLLKDILDKAGIDDKPRDMGRYYIVCTAADGYTTVYSWNELFNSDCSNGVMLVLSVNGSDKLEDGLLLVNTCDKYNGRRHIKWLQSIEVKKA